MFPAVPSIPRNVLIVTLNFSILGLVRSYSVPYHSRPSDANLYPISIPNTGCLMRTNLTPAGIRAASRSAAASKRRAELNDPATPGLNLRITPSGRGTWTWMGRDADGRVRRFGLGHVPTISIAEARRKARKLAEEVRGGADPVRDARTRRKGAKNRAHCNTLSTLLALYGRQQGANIKSWADQMEPQIKRVFRSHLETTLDDLTRGRVATDGRRLPEAEVGILRRALLDDGAALGGGSRAAVRRPRSAGPEGIGRQAASRSCAVQRRACPRAASTANRCQSMRRGPEADLADRMPPWRGVGRTLARCRSRHWNLDAADDEKRHRTS